MIPKIIHYCWFGRGEMPKLARKCIKSWKKYCPDYEIKEWNEDNFDVNIIPYVKEAYQAKKYAFVSDYARFWMLYKYGGLYFDTDVEIIRPINQIIERGAFMGCEDEASGATGGVPLVAPGLGLGCNPGLGLYKEILDFYETIHFRNEDGSLNLHTVVEYTTNILLRYGLKDTNEIQQCAGVYVYPKEFFCPKSYSDGLIHKTRNTVTIHHFAASWHSWSERFYHKHNKIAKRYPRIYYYCMYLPIYELRTKILHLEA